jgi:hypothetical protein
MRQTADDASKFGVVDNVLGGIWAKSLIERDSEESL